MTHAPRIKVEAIGRERHMLVTVDDFVDDPRALRTAAERQRFVPASNHYPGIRAPLPPTYEQAIGPILRQIFGGIFGRHGDPATIDISFSMVTTPPELLTPHQVVPHCDAFTADRFALLHYLGDNDLGGTAFFRHRATGFEAIDEARAGAYFAETATERDIEAGANGYIHGSTDAYEQIALAAPRFNRALVYPGYVLHSGAIAPDVPLSSDPKHGRLTVTGFFSVGVR